MKFLIVSFALAAVASAQYQPTVALTSVQNAGILRQASDVGPDGSYSFTYETENGIFGEESGTPNNLGPNGEGGNSVQGGYAYTAPDGQRIELRYKAGPNGFEPVGAHIPVAPPIPELILRSLAYNAAHPQKEEVQYYKPETQKPYYPQPTPTEKPFFGGLQYTTPKPYYNPGKPVQPTFQPIYPTGFPTQQPFGYTPQAVFNQAGRR